MCRNSIFRSAFVSKILSQRDRSLTTMFSAFLLPLIFALFPSAAFSSSPSNDGLNFDSNILGTPPGTPPHPPGPPLSGVSPALPGGGWIFDTFPMLMNATLFYIGCGLTVALWLTGVAVRKLEDIVDHEGYKTMEPDCLSKEEQVGLVRSRYHMGGDVGSSKNGYYSGYGAVQTTDPGTHQPQI